MIGLLYKEYTAIKQSQLQFLLIFGSGIMAFIWGQDKAGLYLSAACAITVGTLVSSTLAEDDQCGWRKYEIASPLPRHLAIFSKYLTVLLLIFASLLVSSLSSLISVLRYPESDSRLMLLSLLVAVLVPSIWCGVFIPLGYVTRSKLVYNTQVIFLIPLVYYINRIDEGTWLFFPPDKAPLYSSSGILCALLFLLFSCCISILICQRKEYL